MKIISSFFLLIFFCLVAGCDKTTPFTIDVSQITFTDSLGNSSGTADNTDWTQDAEWNETEKSFFRTDPVDLSGTEVASITLLPAYPNPTSVKQITIRFTASAITYLRLALVDRQLNKLSFYSFITVAGLNAFIIPFDETKFSANNNYRLYYSFDAPGTLMYFKGHGDVRVQ